MGPPAEKKKKHSSADHRPISSAAIGGKQQKPLGSFVTDFGNRRSVRIGMKKNKRILRKIWVCSDIWMDTLPFFDLPQLGLKLALLSPRFNALVDKHFDSQSELPIWRTIAIHKIGTQAKLSVEESNSEFPMPDQPMHNKIRFVNLQIDYIDHSVVTFLRSNRQIFDKGTNLDLYIEAKDVQPIWDVFASEIWSIFATNIRHLDFDDAFHLDNLRRHTSPTVLSDLDIISIYSSDLLPDSIADDGPSATSGQALTKWLNVPRSDGKPKQLICCDNSVPPNIKWISNFKEAFLRATNSSANYKIRLEDFEPTEIGPFELTNERTNELLTLEKKEGDHGNIDVVWLLKRCQIGKTIQWEDEKLNNMNNVSFMLCGTSCIGPLSPPKADKMNAKSPLEMNPGPSGQRKKKK